MMAERSREDAIMTAIEWYGGMKEWRCIESAVVIMSPEEQAKDKQSWIITLVHRQTWEKKTVLVMWDGEEDYNIMDYEPLPGVKPN